MRSPIKPLDRYVFAEFWKIFAITAIGFPVITIIIDLTDQLHNYIGRHLTLGTIALSYLYWIPNSMFMVLPAAVLFATVFSIAGFTRHSEITAAKASGVSFYRFVVPVLVGALLATGLDLAISAVMPGANRKHADLLNADRFRGQTQRFNFAFAGDDGRVYTIGVLNQAVGTVEGLQVERRGKGPDYPTYQMVAERARYDAGAWTVYRGTMHVLSDSGAGIVLTYGAMRDNEFRPRPDEMMSREHAPDEMGYWELSRVIRSLERSGTDVNEWKVERALKIAIPVTCIIIALFGAPLATSNQRGGAAYGIAISLLTTVTFLMAVQVTKAVGRAAIVPPDLAAWVPNALFAIVGLALLVRVRT